MYEQEYKRESPFHHVLLMQIYVYKYCVEGSDGYKWLASNRATLNLEPFHQLGRQLIEINETFEKISILKVFNF